jgi:hypothetical protein
VILYRKPREKKYTKCEQLFVVVDVENEISSSFRGAYYIKKTTNNFHKNLKQISLEKLSRKNTHTFSFSSFACQKHQQQQQQQQQQAASETGEQKI